MALGLVPAALTLGPAKLLIGKSHETYLRRQNGHMSSNETERLVQLAWRKASFCASGECVEVAQRDGEIILRDSTQPSGRMLHWGTGEWRAFVRTVKTGELSVQRP
jgi:Domain of unknown function (DUF397)